MPYWLVADHSSYPTRHHPRLSHYDYTTPGFYFVTVCVRRRLPLLGSITDREMHPSAAGMMVHDVWEALPAHYAGVATDSFVVMPNHVHGIVVLQPEDCTGSRAALSLPDVLQRFKSLSTTRYQAGVKREDWPRFAGTFWQQSYYERVIRNDKELDEVRRYILDNPARWAMDRENPDNIR
jgi:REP element-mobilizing transposase RayT